MDNVKSDAYYVEKILTDLHFIAKHMAGVDIKKLEKDEIFLILMYGNILI